MESWSWVPTNERRWAARTAAGRYPRPGTDDLRHIRENGADTLGVVASFLFYLGLFQNGTLLELMYLLIGLV